MTLVASQTVILVLLFFLFSPAFFGLAGARLVGPRARPPLSPALSLTRLLACLIFFTAAFCTHAALTKRDQPRQPPETMADAEMKDAKPAASSTGDDEESDLEIEGEIL